MNVWHRLRRGHWPRWIPDGRNPFHTFVRCLWCGQRRRDRTTLTGPK